MGCRARRDAGERGGRSLCGGGGGSMSDSGRRYSPYLLTAYFSPPRRRRSSVVRVRFEGVAGGFHSTEPLARARRPGNAGVPPANGTARPPPINAGGTRAFPGRRAQERSREACPAKTPPRTCLSPRTPVERGSSVRQASLWRSSRWDEPGAAPAGRASAPAGAVSPGTSVERGDGRSRTVPVFSGSRTRTPPPAPRGPGGSARRPTRGAPRAHPPPGPGPRGPRRRRGPRPARG